MASVENIAFTPKEVKAIIMSLVDSIEITSTPDPRLNKEARETLADLNNHFSSALEKMKKLDNSIILQVEAIQEIKATQEDIDKYTKPD